MPTLVDHNATLFAYLTSCASLCSTLGHTPSVQRIYGPPAGIPAGITQPVPLLLFSCDGGPGDPHIPMATLHYTFYCYGATQAGAHTVFRELFDALHRRSRTDVTITTGVKHLLSWAELENGPLDLPEPQLDWPRVVCSFTVRFAERQENW